MISLKDYFDVNQGGFGAATQADIAALNKALTAGYGSSPATQTGGGALRVESLEKTLHVLTHRSKHARFWQNIPKLPAYNTVEEYNRLEEYGSEFGGFVPEGALPESEDTTYSRQTALVRFLGTTREVSLQMLMVRAAHGDVVALETMAGTNWLLRVLERGLFYAENGVIDEEFNGIDVQIRDGSGPVVDLRGATLTEGFISQGAQQIADNYGIPTSLYLGYRASHDLHKSLFPKERTMVPVGGGGDLGWGFVFKNMVTEFGNISINPDVFIRPGNSRLSPMTSGAASKAPAAPSVATAAGGTGSQLAGATYRYIVSAVNRFGESVGSSAATATPTAGQNVTLTITTGAESGSQVDETGYRIYRSPAGGASGTEKFLFKVARADSGDTTYVDTGLYIEGTEQAWLIQEDLENISFKQLAPFIKVPLATIAAAVRWMQMLFGTPVIYSPKKNVRFINIGTSS